LRRDFFRDEYIVNRRIYRFAKPWISLIDGIDMGGGVGMSVHGSHSVASEKFLFAMPETTIGLFPDVGGGYFLTRLPGALGTFLALTSYRLKVADAVWAGIVDAHVPSARMSELLAALGAADLSGPDANRKVDKVIARFATDAGAPTLPALMPEIDRCFSAESVREIEAKLRKQPGEWAQKQLAALLKLSPLSMAITLEQLRRCANRSFEDAMTIEYRMSQYCMRPDHDFFEGVRALLVDKDQKPKWKPATIDAVTPAMVEAHFQPVANDLLFE
jgi:enoyl-CoA hydratase/carnithine racemase